MKLRKRWLWIGGTAVVTLFLAVALLRPKPGREVQVARAEKRNLVALVKAPGTVEPEIQVNVSAEVPGKIVELRVREGESVERGQLLLRLDDTNVRQIVRQEEARLAAARSRLRAAEARLRAAEPLYERRRALFEQQLLSAGEMEQAENEYQNAVADAEAARDEVARQQAALIAARDQLAKTIYRSPIPGTVIELNVEEGEIVVVGTMNNPGTRILTVADLSRMVVRAEVDETDVVDVRLDQRATIEVDALPDTTFAGRVTEIGHSPMLSGGGAAAGETDFEVEVLFDRQVPEVRPGMTADVEIETATRDSALSVPIQSVVVRSPDDLEERDERGGGELEAAEREGEGGRDVTGVFVLVDGKAVFRRVVTGIASDTHIEVEGDFEPGATVITGPYNVLRNLEVGQRVKAEKPGRGRRGRS